MTIPTVRISVTVQQEGSLRQLIVEDATFEAAVVAVLRLLTQRSVPVVGTAS